MHHTGEAQQPAELPTYNVQPRTKRAQPSFALRQAQAPSLAARAWFGSVAAMRYWLHEAQQPIKGFHALWPPGTHGWLKLFFQRLWLKVVRAAAVKAPLFPQRLQTEAQSCRPSAAEQLHVQYCCARARSTVQGQMSRRSEIFGGRGGRGILLCCDPILVVSPYPPK